MPASSPDETAIVQFPEEQPARGVPSATGERRGVLERDPELSALADAIVETLRGAIAKYRDYKVAVADHFIEYLPNLRQPMYHFTNYEYAAQAHARFALGFVVRPLALKLAVGPHEVQCFPANGKAHSMTVMVEEGVMTKFRFDLEETQ